MADRSLYTQEAAVKEANVIALSIADSGALPTPLEGAIRLFDSTLTPDSTTTKVQLVAAETTMSGYPVGGYPVEDMVPAQNVSGGGVVITTPTVPINYTAPTGGALGGGWLEDHEGDVRQVYIFDPPRVVMSAADGFLLIRQQGYGRNP